MAPFHSFLLMRTGIWPDFESSIVAWLLGRLFTLGKMLNGHYQMSTDLAINRSRLELFRFLSEMLFLSGSLVPKVGLWNIGGVLQARLLPGNSDNAWTALRGTDA
jgi:hypothetical protein